MSVPMPRRQFLQSSGTRVLVLPLLLVAVRTEAAVNPDLRSQLKYQDTPFEGKACTSCLEFVPNPGAPARGTCKVLPGDDEIAADGWCTLWNTL